MLVMVVDLYRRREATTSGRIRLINRSVSCAICSGAAQIESRVASVEGCGRVEIEDSGPAAAIGSQLRQEERSAFGMSQS